MTLATHRSLLNASWLLKLRWAAVVGQMLTIAFVGCVLKIPLFWEPLLVIIGATTVSNLFLHLWLSLHRQANPPTDDGHGFDLCLGLVSTMDLLSLTALLYATGGVSNPFFLFLFVNLGLSAILLPRTWVWGLNVLAVFCFVFLLYDHYSIAVLESGPDLQPVRSSGVWSILQLGMIVAFAGCSSVVVYFLTRLTSSLRQHEFELREAQRLTAQNEKLEALGTLAAGTAHELATPLSTIAVVAREVEKAVESRLGDHEFNRELVDDIRLIRCELDRCRKILDRMSADAGQTIGEAMQAVSLDRLKTETLAGLSDAGRVDWKTLCCDKTTTALVPLMSLSQALRGLIQNGLDASTADRRVSVEVNCEQSSTWTIRVQDRGAGMIPETASRVGEPFFTTKPPGKGMGLGVFLADNLIRRLGGQMKFQSIVGNGTTVTIHLPNRPLSGEMPEAHTHSTKYSDWNERPLSTGP